MHRLRKLSLLAAAAVLAVGLTSTTDRSPASAATQTAGSWTYIRSTCRVLTAGTVCLSLLSNGQPNTYHLNLTFAPKPGQWFQRVALAEWQGKNFFTSSGEYSGEVVGRYSGTQYEALCSSGCEKTTTTQTYVIPRRDFAVYTILFDTPQGRYDVNAGVSVFHSAGDYSCFGKTGAVAVWQLSSRNTNGVYLVEHLTYRSTLPQHDVTAKLTNDQAIVQTYVFRSPKPDTTYSSPRSVVVPWKRTTFRAPADLQEPSAAPIETFWRTQTVSTTANDTYMPSGENCIT